MNKNRILVFLFCLIFIIVGVSGCGDVDPDVLALTGAEQVVKEKLKAPSTAKFSSWGETKITKIKDNTYLVKGYVDAQNGFGAMIRSNYSVEITIKDQENFSYKNLIIK